MVRLGLLGCLAVICIALTACSSSKQQDKPSAKQDVPADPDRESRKESANNLRQIGLALHMYHERKGHFPGGPDKLSWRVTILPELGKEAAALHAKFKLDEPWDSPRNKPLLAEMPKVFEDPRFPAEKGKTYYQSFKGQGGVLNNGHTHLKLVAISISNGTGNTLMLVEAATPVPWTKPDDVEVVPGKPFPKLGGPKNANFLGLFVDNKAHLFSANADERLLRMASDWSNTEAFELPPSLEDR